MKTGWKCKQEKPTSDFYKEKRKPDGLQSSCKPCQKDAYELFKKRNPEYFSEHGKKAYLEKYKANNKDRYKKYQASYLKRRSDELQTVRGRVYGIFSGARARSEKSGTPFDITLDWLLAKWDASGGRCEVTGISLTTQINAQGERFFSPFNPSLDQIKAGQGYTESNTRIVCVMVNLALNKFGDEAFDTMCEAYMAQKAARTAIKSATGA